MSRWVMRVCKLWVCRRYRHPTVRSISPPMGAKSNKRLIFAGGEYCARGARRIGNHSFGRFFAVDVPKRALPSWLYDRSKVRNLAT
jgi:hypothetical protein